jgi:hypothetical protein
MPIPRAILNTVGAACALRRRGLSDRGPSRSALLRSRTNARKANTGWPGDQPSSRRDSLPLDIWRTCRFGKTNMPKKGEHGWPEALVVVIHRLSTDGGRVSGAPCWNSEHPQGRQTRVGQETSPPVVVIHCPLDIRRACRVGTTNKPKQCEHALVRAPTA